jgi:hypothetical protein
MDRKTAQTLLTGLHRGRRKRRAKPLYEKAWFQATAISGLLLAVAGVLYLVFRPPSPEKLFAQAQRLMETKDPQQIAQARNGPIQDYLSYYGDRTDSQTRQMQDWANRYDVALREQQLDNRQRLKWSPEGEAEVHARRARHGEEVGDWGAVNEEWREVTKLKGDADPDLRVWRLLAQKRLGDLATAAALEQELPQQAHSSSLNLDVVQQRIQAVRSDPEFPLNEDRLLQAFKAFRYERFGDFPAARANWQDLKQSCERDMEQRPLFLLAAKRSQDPRILQRATSPKEETGLRLQRIRERLEDARRLAADKQLPEAARLCTDISDLYHHYPDFRDDPDPALKQLVAQAEQLLDQVSRQREPKH